MIAENLLRFEMPGSSYGCVSAGERHGGFAVLQLRYTVLVFRGCGDGKLNACCVASCYRSLQ